MHIDIIREVEAELVRQKEKWGEQNHHPSLWALILMEEVGEYSQAALEAHFSTDPKEKKRGDENWASARKELVQVAAVAISMIDSIERNQLSCPYCESGIINTPKGNFPCPSCSKVPR